MNKTALAAFALIPVALACLVPGCGGGDSPIVTDMAMPTTDSAVAGPPDLDVGPRSTYTETEAQTAREACTFKSGALPGVSIAKDAPLGAQIPIDTIIIVMMENRSFDHILGNLKNA